MKKKATFSRNLHTLYSKDSNICFIMRPFTLMELLIVIGIIAVLAAMLLPALNQTQNIVKRISCASNLRQIALCDLAYTNDWSGWFPQQDAMSTKIFQDSRKGYFPDPSEKKFSKRYMAIAACPAVGKDKKMGWGADETGNVYTDWIHRGDLTDRKGQTAKPIYFSTYIIGTGWGTDYPMDYSSTWFGRRCGLNFGYALILPNINYAGRSFSKSYTDSSNKNVGGTVTFRSPSKHPVAGDMSTITGATMEARTSTKNEQWIYYSHKSTGMNNAYGDGHVKFSPMKEVPSNIYDKNRYIIPYNVGQLYCGEGK